MTSAWVFQLLEDESTDLREWKRAWVATGREPFAHPEYCRAFAGPDGEIVGLTARSSEGIVLIPLIRRPLPPGPVATEFDLVSPYGYGGPFYSKVGPIPTELISGIRDWVAASAYASCFIRVSLGAVPPSLPMAQDAGLVPERQNVSIDLTRPANERWMQYAHKVRKNVRRAEREGCVVTFPDSTDNSAWTAFGALYRTTMQRRRADDWYHLSDTFLLGLGRSLPSETLQLVFVSDADGVLISAELVLVGSTSLYSFLGGTLPEAYSKRPNDLLKHSVGNWGMERGKRRYVLGGGFADGDGIFTYKASFAPEGVYDYFVWRLVGNKSVYDKAVSSSPSDDPHFFPPYRATREPVDDPTNALPLNEAPQ